MEKRGCKGTLSRSTCRNGTRSLKPNLERLEECKKDEADAQAARAALMTYAARRDIPQIKRLPANTSRKKTGPPSLNKSFDSLHLRARRRVMTSTKLGTTNGASQEAAQAAMKRGHPNVPLNWIYQVAAPVGIYRSWHQPTQWRAGRR